MNKQQWLDWAEIVDAFRIVPRFILWGYFYFCLWYVWRTTEWYFALPERGANETAFISITLPALFGMSAWITKLYMRSGRKWAEMNRDD